MNLKGVAGLVSKGSVAHVPLESLPASCILNQTALSGLSIPANTGRVVTLPRTRCKLGAVRGATRCHVCDKWAFMRVWPLSPDKADLAASGNGGRKGSRSSGEATVRIPVALNVDQ